MSSALVSLIVVANVTLSVVVLGRTVQRSERSRFRYETWRVRDELVDQIRSGDVRPTGPMLEYLDRLELNIGATEVMTPFRYVVAAYQLRRAGWRPVPDDLPARAEMPERRAIREASRRVTQARVRLLLWGSPSGWLLVLASPLVFVASVLTDQRKRQTSDEDEPSYPLAASMASWSSERYGSTITVLKNAMESDTDDGHGKTPAYA